MTNCNILTRWFFLLGFLCFWSSCTIEPDESLVVGRWVIAPIRGSGEDFIVFKDDGTGYYEYADTTMYSCEYNGVMYGRNNDFEWGIVSKGTESYLSFSPINIPCLGYYEVLITFHSKNRFTLGEADPEPFLYPRDNYMRE